MAYHKIDRKKELPRLRQMPWKERLKTVFGFTLKRIDETRLIDVAGMISFTIVLSIVPILTVLLGLFTKFPLFSSLRTTLEGYFAQGMFPPRTTQRILSYLNDFVANASNVSIVGAIALLFTTLSTISTINNAFDRIWKIVLPRPLIRRYLLYLTIAILTPAFFAGTFFLTSLLFLSEYGVFSLLSWLPFLNEYSALILSILWTSVAFALLYRALPNRVILMKDALVGGLFSAVMYEIAIKFFAFFIVKFTSYRQVYGALCALPIFFFWIYICSIIVLLGALLTSMLPDFRNAYWSVEKEPGREFSDAIKAISILYNHGRYHRLTVTCLQIEARTLLSVVDIEKVLFTMQKAGWVTLQKQSILDAFWIKRRIEGRWKWNGLEEELTVADVFALFAHSSPSNGAVVAKDIDAMIDENFSMTLKEYIATHRKVADTVDDADVGEDNEETGEARA